MDDYNPHADCERKIEDLSADLYDAEATIGRMLRRNVLASENMALRDALKECKIFLRAYLAVNSKSKCAAEILARTDEALGNHNGQCNASVE